jgi:lysophospholipase L1-like esterase
MGRARSCRNLFGVGALGVAGLLAAQPSCLSSCGQSSGSAAGGAGGDTSVIVPDAGAGAAGGGDGVGAPSVIAAGVRWFGRIDTVTDPDHPRFAWSASGFVAGITGGTFSVDLENDGPFMFKAVIDGEPQPPFAVTAGEGTYVLADSLPDGMHTVALYRQTEGWYGNSQLLALTVDGGTLLAPPAAAPRLIEVVGASVSCGYGNLGAAPCGFTFPTESAFDAYESVAARAVGAELSVVAISGRGVYRNSDGTLADTMPQIYERIFATSPDPPWDFRVTPQVVVINLGKNDLAVGDPGQAFIDAYVTFTGALRDRYPDAFIVCTTGPNLGDANHAIQLAYVGAALDARHAAGDDRIVLLDWPEDTADDQGCDGHPNAAKHQTMGDALAGLLRARLGW